MNDRIYFSRRKLERDDKCLYINFPLTFMLLQLWHFEVDCQGKMQKCCRDVRCDTWNTICHLFYHTLSFHWLEYFSLYFLHQPIPVTHWKLFLNLLLASLCILYFRFPYINGLMGDLATIIEGIDSNYHTDSAELIIQIKSMLETGKTPVKVTRS